jgi:hypothetical protein
MTIVAYVPAYMFMSAVNFNGNKRFIVTDMLSNKHVMSIWHNGYPSLTGCSKKQTILRVSLDLLMKKMENYLVIVDFRMARRPSKNA